MEWVRLGPYPFASKVTCKLPMKRPQLAACTISVLPPPECDTTTGYGPRTSLLFSVLLSSV